MANSTPVPKGYKRCSECKQVKPLDQFHQCKSRSDGKQYKCIDCVHQNYLARKSRPKIEIEFKCCSLCKIVKPIDEYHLNPLSPDGHRHDCIECVASRYQRYIADPKNKKKAAETNATWYKRNRETIRARQNRRYASRSKPAIKVKEKKCVRCLRILPIVQFHKKRDSIDGYTSICAECKSQYDKETRPIYRQTQRWRIISIGLQQKRRAYLANAKGSYTREDIETILRIQGNRCYWCQKDMGAKWTIDHRIPISRGGSNDASNIVLCCSHCNSSKHNKMPWEWIGRLL